MLRVGAMRRGRAMLRVRGRVRVSSPANAPSNASRKISENKSSGMGAFAAPNDGRL